MKKDLPFACWYQHIVSQSNPFPINLVGHIQSPVKLVLLFLSIKKINKI